MTIDFCRMCFLAAAMLFFCGCTSNKTPLVKDPLFQQMENTGIDFINTVNNSQDFNIFSYRNFYNGGGAAIGDINNDGLPDIFFTANMGSNKLYLNKGNWQFEDISEKAGITEKDQWSTGVVMADINHDGWLDIYVCNAGYVKGKIPENKLFINNHNLTFSDSAVTYGLSNKGGYTTHAAFFDYDMDGDLDCFIINNSFIPVNTLNYANKRDMMARDWPVADFLKGGGERFLRNDDGKFTDISQQAGIHGSLISFGLGVTVGDVNGDLWPDVYVSNDFFERDYLYINQKNGTFKDELEKYMQHISHSSMGADMADINNDGLMDIFVTEMLPRDETRLKTTTSFENVDVQKLKINSGFYHQFMQNTLQVNNGNGRFAETAFYSGVAATDWSWGGLIFDADNDGLNDLFVCNGIYNDVTDQDFIDFFANDVVQKMALTGKKEEMDHIIKKMPSRPIPNYAFRNIGDLKFEETSAGWGLNKPSFSNGAAYGDLDNDGDLDLIVNNVNEKCFVYKNTSQEKKPGNFIGVKLKGKHKNTFAVGSTVKIFQGDKVQVRELIPSRGFQSSVDYKLNFGTGSTPVDSLLIIWPDQTYTSISKPALNQYHFISQDSSSAALYNPSSLTELPLFTLSQQSFDRHVEDDYTDFYFERNMPVLLSKQGPAAATGDVNGDGLQDIYIGGAANTGGQLYLQSATGYQESPQRIFEQYRDFEDVAAIFFDADNDGDLDLCAGAGGNNHPAGSRQLLLRLYKNDGKGSFEIDIPAIKDEGMNTSVITTYDYDNDGDQDLFVGSRSMPQQYGVSPRSYLFENNGKGQFTDVTKRSPELLKPGMITGAVWANVTGDKQKELVIVGEWMTPKVFAYNGKKFTEIKTNLDDKYGWWQTIAAADLDGNGYDDLVLGNIGENFYLQPDAAKPVKLWLGDFDGNNIADKIITRTVDGKDMPVFLKRELTDQLPSLKKKNLKHHDYAQKSIQELIEDEKLKQGIQKSFTYPSSCIALSSGNNSFTINKLPPEIQLSSVNAIALTDVNSDGIIDIVIGGNQCGLLPQFCRVDASFGSVLIGKGKGTFKNIQARQSGLDITGEVRNIRMLENGKNSKLLFLRNNDFPVMYQLTSKH